MEFFSHIVIYLGRNMGKKLYRSGDILSITINPSPPRQMLNEDSFKTRKNRISSEWVKEFYLWYRRSAIKSVQVWIEISWTGLIHYHGCVTIDDPREFASILGQMKYPVRGQPDVNIDVDTISDMDAWLTYCTKDADIMGMPLVIPVMEADTQPTLLPVATINKHGQKGHK